MEVLWEMFLEHIISLCGELPWPARLPNISTYRGHLKEKVYTTRQWIIDDLKIVIRKQISAFPENMERRALENL
jgi:hypothetical protein